MVSEESASLPDDTDLHAQAIDRKFPLSACILVCCGTISAAVVVVLKLTCSVPELVDEYRAHIGCAFPLRVSLCLSSFLQEPPALDWDWNGELDER